MQVSAKSLAQSDNLNPESRRRLAQLVEDVEKHGLVVFVGSGINARALPQWRELLQHLLKRLLLRIESDNVQNTAADVILHEWCTNHYDSCAQATIIEHTLGHELYRLEVQHALYAKEGAIEHDVVEYCSGRNITHPEKFEFLRVVAGLCGTAHVKAVVSFNFDTLLECAIHGVGRRKPVAYHGGTPRMVGPQQGLDEIPIYHVHGLLGPPDQLQSGSDQSIVFTYGDYLDTMGDPLAWETSTPLHLMRNYTTLWLGSSLKDWDMMRLIHAAKKDDSSPRAYCIQCRRDVMPYEVTPARTAAATRFQATLLDAIGMQFIVTGAGYETIPPVIEEYLAKPLRQG